MKIYSLKNKNNIYKASLIFIGIILLIILWETSAIIINNNVYLPRIEEVFSSILGIFKSDDFIVNIITSIIRTVISYFSALVIAFIFGIISMMSKSIYHLLKPFNAVVKTMPTMILVVLALIWFDKDKTPYVVGTFIVLPIFYQGIVSALSSVDSRLIDMFKVYKVRKIQLIKKVYFPVIIFYITRTFAATFSLAFKVVIAGEVHGQPRFGIGSKVQAAKANFDVSEIFGWIIIIALLSIFFDAINMFMCKLIKKWWCSYEIESYKN